MSQTTNTIDEEVLFAESYQRLLPRMQALSPAELLPVNLDITSAVSTALGVLPEIRALRPAIAKALPELSLEHVDALEDLARAASYANTQHLIAAAPTDDLPERTGEGIELRQRLRADANALVTRGLMSEPSLKGLTGSTGAKNLARDLQILASSFRDAWVRIEGKCALSTADLDHAERLAARLLRVAGLREQGPVQTAATAELRQREFTAFCRSYDQIRRAVIFLRWSEGDADSIAPSLYAGRGGRGKTTDEAASAATSDAVVTPAAAAPGVVTQSVLVANPNAVVAAPVAPAPTGNVVTGGGTPFTA